MDLEKIAKKMSKLIQKDSKQKKNDIFTENQIFRTKICAF